MKLQFTDWKNFWYYISNITDITYLVIILHPQYVKNSQNSAVIKQAIHYEMSKTFEEIFQQKV